MSQTQEQEYVAICDQIDALNERKAALHEAILEVYKQNPTEYESDLLSISEVRPLDYDKLKAVMREQNIEIPQLVIDDIEGMKKALTQHNIAIPKKTTGDDEALIKIIATKKKILTNKTKANFGSETEVTYKIFRK